MKKVILLASALFVFSLTVNAQEPNTNNPGPAKAQHKPAKKRTPEERAGKQVEQLNNVVGLSEEQKTKVSTLALAKVQKMDAIREKYKGQPENKATAKAEMDAVRKEYRQSVKALMTPEQIEKLKKKGHEMKGKQHKGAEHKSKADKKAKEEVTPEGVEDAVIDGQE